MLAVDLYQVIANGRVWTGTDGFFITDQMQYLAWIGSASHHGLVSNMFVLRRTPADYFQPASRSPAVLVALGMSPPGWRCSCGSRSRCSATFFGCPCYVHRSLRDRARRVAIALGLFYGSFTSSAASSA